MTIGKVYNFKDEFCKELNIPLNQANRRQAELLEWLKNFFDYEFFPGCPIRIQINEIIGEYQPMPRKLPKQDVLNQEKIKDYTEYTIAALGTEFKPNSKSKIARDAIYDFGKQKYHHTNQRSVVERYVKEPFDKYGETNDVQIWVMYSTYEPLPDEILEDWRNILRIERIGEQEAANAFYKQEQGQDISQEKQYYNNAMQRFKEKYNDVPVLVKNWKLKA